ncbi:hypothetical protein ACFQ3W_12195 [Paenibacillus puldeungensis]|uniref:SPOR domain-containing protein n=1 Tax=Paenibacillus puldeungensis TaxID=696536 RepID=A0ABW3RYH3_9BACL
MTRNIQAYFQSEDLVEGARMSLLSYRTEQVEAGHVEDSVAANDNLIVPLLPVSTGTMSTGGSPGTVPIPLTGTMRGGQSILPVIAFGDRNAGDTLNGEQSEAVSGEHRKDPVMDTIDTNDRPQGWKYVLSAKVQEEDYDSIVSKLREQGAFIPDTK